MKRLIGVLSLLILWNIPSGALGMKLEAALGVWYQMPQGGIGYEPVTAGDRIDLEDDFKYDNEFNLTARAKLELPLPIVPNFYLIAAPMKYESTGMKYANFKFGDEPFQAGEQFTSALTLNTYDLALYWGIPFLNLATINTLNIDLGINVRVIDFKIEASQGVDDPTAVNPPFIEASKSITLPVPMAYAAIQLGPVSDCSIEAEARAIQYNDNLIYSLSGRLKYEIFSLAIVDSFVAAGYRYDRIKIDEKGIEADTHFSGPFFEAGVEF